MPYLQIIYNYLQDSISSNLLFFICKLAVLAIITTSISYNKKLSNLVKTYINNIKYSNYNNSFIFKLTIFHNIYFKVYILFKIKIKAFFIMLKCLA